MPIIIFSQKFTSQFAKEGGFDFYSYTTARKDPATGREAIKSPITSVLDWLASLWKSAADASAEEWTGVSGEWTWVSSDSQAAAARVVDPLGSLANAVATGSVFAGTPEKVTGLGNILSQLSDKLKEFDKLPGDPDALLVCDYI